MYITYYIELFVFNGKKSGPVMLIPWFKEDEQIALIIKAYAKNAVMVLIFLPVWKSLKCNFETWKTKAYFAKKSFF